MIGAFEMVVLAIAEIWEIDIDHIVSIFFEDGGEAQLCIAALAVLFFEVPFAVLAPTETGRAKRNDCFAAFVVDRDRLPLGIVRLA